MLVPSLIALFLYFTLCSGFQISVKPIPVWINFGNSIVRVVRCHRDGSNAILKSMQPVCIRETTALDAYNRRFHGTGDSDNTPPAKNTAVNGDGGEDDPADEELRISMARELYDDLCNGNPYLTKDAFLAWDDIVEIVSEGSLDQATMDIIFQEVGVFSDVITFNHFLELVDLVNQVAAALEGNEFSNYDDEDTFESFDDSVDDTNLVLDTSESYEWLLNAMTKKL